MTFRLFFCCLLLSGSVLAQGVEELDRRNGFQDIKMMAAVADYEGLELKRDIKDETFPNSQLYVAKKGYYEFIGSLPITALEVKAYKGSVYEIRVVTGKAPNLYKGLKQIYGEPAFSYNDKNYFWQTDNIRLTYASHSKNKIEMTYYSHGMVRKRKAEKEQVIEDIADDF